MRDNFIFYRSFAEAGKALKEKDRLKLYDAIISLALDEEEKPLTGITNGMFALIKPQIEANNKRYKDGIRGKVFGSKGGRPKNPTGVIENQNLKTPKGLHDETPNENVNVNVNENVKEKEKVEKEKAVRFLPPTLEEVISYCQERGNDVDPEKWYDFYKSKGWMVGSNKMKDWKAAVRTWEKRENPKQPKEIPKYDQAFTDASLAISDADYEQFMRKRGI